MVQAYGSTMLFLHLNFNLFWQVSMDIMFSKVGEVRNFLSITIIAFKEQYKTLGLLDHFVLDCFRLRTGKALVNI